MDAQKEEEFASFRDLLGALGYDCGNNDDHVESGLEDYALGYLAEDLGMNLFVDLVEGECVCFFAQMSFYTEDAVSMWVLNVPVTVSKFHRYLDELDLRVARLRAIVELPPSGGEVDPFDENVSIVEVLSRLFGSHEAEVIAQLGDDWTPVESDDRGVASHPVRYLLWKDRLIVGVDDAYLHLYTPIVGNHEVGVGAFISCFEMGEDETIGLAEFALALHSTFETG